MGYALFASRKIHYCNMISMINSQLDEIDQTRMNLMTLTASISDGKITADEIASDPMNIQSYISFMRGSDAYKQSEQGGKPAVDMLGQILTQHISENPEQSIEFARMAELLNTSIDAEYGKRQAKILAQQERQLDMQQKRLETKLQAAQNELQQIQQAEARAIQEATPKYAGLG